MVRILATVTEGRRPVANEVVILRGDYGHFKTDKTTDAKGRALFIVHIPERGWMGTGYVDFDIELGSTGRVHESKRMEVPTIPPPVNITMELNTVEGKVDPANPDTMLYTVIAETFNPNGARLPNIVFHDLFEGDTNPHETDGQGFKILKYSVKGFGKSLKLETFIPGTRKTWRALELRGPVKPTAPDEPYPTDIELIPDHGTKTATGVLYNVVVKVKGRKPGVNHDTSFGPLGLEWKYGSDFDDFLVNNNGDAYLAVEVRNKGKKTNRVILYCSDPKYPLIKYIDLDGPEEEKPADASIPRIKVLCQGRAVDSNKLYSVGDQLHVQVSTFDRGGVPSEETISVLGECKFSLLDGHGTILEYKDPATSTTVQASDVSEFVFKTPQTPLKGMQSLAIDFSNSGVLSTSLMFAHPEVKDPITIRVRRI